MKDLLVLARDRVALFWVLGFPLLFALFLGAVVRGSMSGEPGPVKVLFVDRNPGPTSEQLRQALATTERLEIAVTTLASAEEAIRQSRALAYVELTGPLGALGAEPHAPDASRGPAFRIGIDPSRQIEAAFVQAALLRAWQRVLSPGMPSPETTELVELVRVEAPTVATRAPADYVFPAAVLWGLIGCAACFAISMVAERTRGTYLRLVASPVPRGAVLAGKALACLIACATVCLTLSAIAYFGFGVRFAAPLKQVLALGSTSLCFVGVTMALSVLGRTEQSVAGAGWATLIVMAMLGGAMVPLSLLPDWLVTLSQLSPVKWSILALEGASWRGFSYAELARPCAVLWSVGAVGFVLGVGTMVRQEA